MIDYKQKHQDTLAILEAVMCNVAGCDMGNDLKKRIWAALGKDYDPKWMPGQSNR